MAHIFISYSRRDSIQLHAIVEALEADGHSVWWDIRSIQGGDDWQNSIITGIVDADIVVVLLSSHSVRSKWVETELDIARSKHKIIIPIKVDDVDFGEIPKFIETEHINLLSGSMDVASITKKLVSDLRGLKQSGSRIPFTIGHPRLTYFIGREDEIREIHKLLNVPKGLGRPRVVVCGMGGIGKTQVCIEYAYRYRYFYPDGIIYLDAQSNINEQLARLAQAITLSHSDTWSLEQQDAIAEKITQYILNLRRALIVLDNVPSMRFLRQMRVGYSTQILSLSIPILLNTRSRYEGSDVNSVDLGPLTDEEAVDLISQNHRDFLVDPETKRLCQALRNVPLALALAAAFFSRKPKANPRTYLAELEKNGWESTISLGHLREGDIEAYPQASFIPALRAQWGLLEHPSTKALLAAAALHAPNTIIPIARLGLMTALSDDADGMRTELSDSVRDAVTANLISKGGDGQLVLHAVIHDFINRLAFKNFNKQKERLLNHTSVALNKLDAVKTTLLQRGVDAIISDLLVMVEIFENAPKLHDLIADWLAVIHGHRHVFGMLSREQTGLGFEQHILLFAQFRSCRRLENMAKRIFKLENQPFFTIRWSSWIPPEQLRTKLNGERGSTELIAVAPHAKWVVTYTGTGVLQVFVLPTGRLHQRMAIEPLHSIAISPEGDRLILLSKAGTLQLLELPDLTEIEDVAVPKGAISLITFAATDALVGLSKEGNLLANISLTKDRIQEYHKVDSDIVGIYRINDTQLFLSLPDSGFAIYDRIIGIITLRGNFEHKDATVLSFYSDNEAILVAMQFGIYQISLHNGEVRCINDVFGRGGRTDNVAFFNNGRYAASASFRNTIAIIDLQDPTAEIKLISSDTVDDIAAGATNWPLFIAGNKGYSELNVWDFSSGIPEPTEKIHDNEIVNILTVGNGVRFVTTSMDWSAVLWDRHTGRPIQSICDGFVGYAKGLAKTVADDRFLVGYTFKTVLYDVMTGSELGSFRPPCDGVTAIAMAPSGKFFATGSSDGVFMIWSEYGDLVHHIVLEEGMEICSIVVSRDESIIAGGTTSGLIFVFRSPWSEVSQWPSQRGITSSVCLSPSGDLLYSAHDNGDICAWHTSDGELSYVLQAHRERVTALAQKDEHSLISASADGSVRFWSLQRRKQFNAIMIGQPISCIDYHVADSTLLIGLSVGDVLALSSNPLLL